MGVYVSLITGRGFGGDAEGDTLVSIENLDGSPHGDVSWSAMTAPTCLYGDGGDDSLKGGGGVDTLYGASGNDILDGGSGADRMFGGRDNDTYIVDNAVGRGHRTPRRRRGHGADQRELRAHRQAPTSRP